MGNTVVERCAALWRPRRKRCRYASELDIASPRRRRIATCPGACASSQTEIKGPMNRAADEAHDLVRNLAWDLANASREILLEREWIVTNALGGYASGTVSGAVTRRYHGLLIAALPAPLGRVVMWNHLSEFLRFGPNEVVSLGGEERAGGQLDLHGAEYLREFRLEEGLPVWTYRIGDLVIEKRIWLPRLQNTVYVNYKVIEGHRRARLELRPAF